MFDDLRVLELASVLAGPSVGQFFAELGADVIKVENLQTGGDVTRTWKLKDEDTDDRSAYFCSVNSGKRSIALDLNTTEGRDVVRRLARNSDIVIASYKPGDAEKLGVDYASLSSENASIIYGQITGYGSDDPRVGYDAVIQAEAGFMYMNGEPGGRSLKIPVAIIDILAAHQLKEAVLVALLKKSRTGQGSFVEVSLLQAAISALVNQATNWLVAGHSPGKQGSAHPNIAPYGDTFTTSDGVEVLLAIGSDKQFHDLCVLLQLNDLSSTSDFINNKARVQNRARLNKLLQESIRGIESSRFIDELNKRKIPGGLIRKIEDVFSLDQARELTLPFKDVTGLRTYVGSPRPERAPGPPPHFGEHTASILSELGL